MNVTPLGLTKKKFGAPEMGTKAIVPSMVDEYPPVTCEMTLLIPALEVVKRAVSLPTPAGPAARAKGDSAMIPLPTARRGNLVIAPRLMRIIDSAFCD